MDLSDKNCRAVIVKTAIKNLLNSDDKLNFLYDATLDRIRDDFIYAESIHCSGTAHDDLIDEFNAFIEALSDNVDKLVDMKYSDEDEEES